MKRPRGRQPANLLTSPPPPPPHAACCNRLTPARTGVFGRRAARRGRRGKVCCPLIPLNPATCHRAGTLKRRRALVGGGCSVYREMVLVPSVTGNLPPPPPFQGEAVEAGRTGCKRDQTGFIGWTGAGVTEWEVFCCVFVSLSLGRNKFAASELINEQPRAVIHISAGTQTHTDTHTHNYG